MILTAKIGLPILRQGCQHFHDWLIRIETLGEIT